MNEVKIDWFCIAGCDDHCTLTQSKRPNFDDCKKESRECEWVAHRFKFDEKGIGVMLEYVEWLRTHGTLVDMIMWKEELISRGYFECSLGIPCHGCETLDCELPEEVK